MAVVPIVISCLALSIAIATAFYAARTAKTNERRLRGESDAARTTYFELRMPGKFVYVRSRVGEPWVHSVKATNVGDSDAKDVVLTVTSADGAESWTETSELVVPNQRLSVTVGNFSGKRTFAAEVSWKDGRRMRRKYRRTLQSS